MSLNFGFRFRTTALAACLALFVLTGGFSRTVQAADDENGYVPVFDGKSLDGWDGDPRFWRVEDGAITGETTAENPTQGNTFLIWRGGELQDFELKVEFKLRNHNSGIQYRSFELGRPWGIGGYQADLAEGDKYTGILYGEQFRGILSLRGDKSVIGPDHKPKVVGSVGDSAELNSHVKVNDWNEFHVIAKGYHFVHKINGHVMSECTDEDPTMRRAFGLLALQLHAGPPMKVQFRNLRVKHLKPELKRQIALIAGKKSHGYGAHEHRAGCMLLAKALNEAFPDVQATVYTEGWPEDPTVLNDAHCIVIYADGGGGHPFNAHLAELQPLMKKGTGLVCIHYAVEVPKEKTGEAFLDWTGGYFETNWSVNPHWTADYAKFPEHPVTRGVKPFSVNDEWYFHMRFRQELEGVTPILTAIPPESTMSRPDGPHSGNPAVREAVAAQLPQHMAWARVRPDQGRGFGITGGHIHWNWGNDNFRKLVLNAIAWGAHVEVPAEGVASAPLTVEDLEANQDYEQPANFDRKRIQTLLDEWNAKDEKR